MDNKTNSKTHSLFHLCSIAAHPDPKALKQIEKTYRLCCLFQQHRIHRSNAYARPSRKESL